MADESLAAYIERDRARLHAEREAVFTQQAELEKKLAEINRELAAITAYESAKAGKPISAPSTRAAKKAGTKRKGSKRDGLLAAIKANPAGMTRGDLLTQLGVKGDKSSEMSVSNALTGLIKNKSITRADGKYRAVT